MAELSLAIVSLFHTCLEGYKLCLTISSSSTDLKILRTRMYLEKERFLNIGRVCGIVKPLSTPLPSSHSNSAENGTGGGSEETRKAEFTRFLAEDGFRRRAVMDTLELIDALLEKADQLNQKYSSSADAGAGIPGELLDDDLKISLRGKFNRLTMTMKKTTWSIRDKAAYEDLLAHLTGFNNTLSSILPVSLQGFLATVTPATICASSNEEVLQTTREVGSQASGYAFLKAQCEWASAVRDVNGNVGKGKEWTMSELKDVVGVGDKKEKDKDRTRFLATAKDDGSSSLMIEWTAWETPTQQRLARTARISGLLVGEKCAELKMLRCVGYMEEHSVSSEKSRYALVYDFEAKRKKVKSLHELLESFKTVQLPALETRLDLARNLCRAMLLYHASGWIHHDFRSFNVVFAENAGFRDKAARYIHQDVDVGEPFVVGFGHARDEVDISLMFADKNAISKTLKQQRRYWSPDYLGSSAQKRTNRSFQRSHDIYSLGCVLLEIGVWRPLESYTWESSYDADHRKWHKRLLKEEGKLRAMCGSRYAEAVMKCLQWTTADIEADVQALAFEILLKLEEIVV